MKELNEGDEFRVIKGVRQSCVGCILRVRKNDAVMKDYADVFYSINKKIFGCNANKGSRTGLMHCFINGSGFHSSTVLVKNDVVTGVLSIGDI